MIIKPRDYQIEALDALEKGRSGQEGLRQLVALATGGGKTIIAALDMKRVVEETGKGAIFMAHRDELIIQPMGKIKLPGVWPDATIGRVKAEHNELGKQVTVASVQTICRDNRLTPLIEAQDYSLLYIDEAHHAVAPTYKKVIEALCAANPQLIVVGLTATPVRTDATQMKDVFQEVTYHKSMIDLIKTGYLSDLALSQVDLDVSIDGVPMRKGELKTSDLREIMLQESIMESMVESWKKNVSPRRTIAFAIDVAHANRLAEIFRENGVAATSIYGELETEKRRERLAKFQAGEYQVMVNCMVLCLDSETELLTDRGWTSMDEMSFEHNVANYDAVTGEITFETPLDIVKRPRQPNERMVVLEAPDRSIRVTEGHRILYRSIFSSEEPWRKKSALELVGKKIALPIAFTHDHLEWLSSQDHVDIFDGHAINHTFKVEEGWKEETVWCVRTRTSNLVTRRKGSITITGNTEGYDDETTGDAGPLECIMLSRPTLSQSLYIQMVGRGTRKAPTKENCMVLDFTYNTKRHHVVQLPHLFGLEENDEPKEPKEFDPEEDDGKTTKIKSIVAAVREAEEIDIDAPPPRVNFRWPKTRKGWFCLSIGRSLGYLLIRPTDADPKMFEVFHLDPQGDGKSYADYVVHRLSKPMTFDWAFGLAEDAVRNFYGATERRSKPVEHLYTSADWMDLPPTEPQLRVLQRAGETAETRGEATDKITVLVVEGIIRARASKRTPATAKQRGYLRGKGIPFSENINKTTASRLISEHKKRQQEKEIEQDLQYLPH